MNNVCSDDDVMDTYSTKHPQLLSHDHAHNAFQWSSAATTLKTASPIAATATLELVALLPVDDGDKFFVTSSSFYKKNKKNIMTGQGKFKN